MTGTRSAEDELLEIFRRETLARMSRAARDGALVVIGVILFSSVLLALASWPVRVEHVVRALRAVEMLLPVFAIGLVLLTFFVAVFLAARFPTKDLLILRWFRARREHIVAVGYVPLRPVRFWDGAPTDRPPVGFAVVLQTPGERMLSPALPEPDAKRAATLFHALAPRAELVGPR